MTDIFEGQQPTADQQQQLSTPPQPAIPETLKELVGEGKKYSTLDAALASIGPAQAHIAKLEAEAAQLREQAAKGQSVDEVRQAVEAILEARGATNTPALDPNAVASVVDNLLSEREIKARSEANQKTVTDALTAAFGDKASDKFSEAAAAAGLSRQELSDLARKSPAVALKLFDLKPQGAPQLRSDLNPEAFGKPATPPKKDVMRGGATKDLVAEWRSHTPKD